MRNVKYALRTSLAGTLLSLAVAAAPALALDADLGVTFAAATAVKYGGTKAYKATVTNIGPNHATGVTVDAVLPAGFELVSVAGCTPTAAAAAADASFPCTLADLTDTFSASFTVTLMLPLPVDPACGATGNGTYEPLTVTVTSTSTDANAANNSASITPSDVPVNWADVAVDFSGPSSAAAGASVTYDVLVTNAGPCPATAIWAYSDAYGSAPFVSSTAVCNNVLADGESFEADGCDLGDLGVGESIAFQKVYTIPAMSSDAISLYHPNGVSIEADQLDLNTDNNTSDMSTYVTQSVGCSSAGAGGPTGLLALGAVLALVLRRRAV